MATELKNIKRKFELTEAGLTLLAKQWGYGEDTRRIVVNEDDGTTKRYYWDSTRLADQTSSYGASLIGIDGITGVTPDGGSLGGAGTVRTMIRGIGAQLNFGSLTTNVLPRKNSSNTLVDSAISDDGATIAMTRAVSMSSTLGVTGIATFANTQTLFSDASAVIRKSTDDGAIVLSGGSGSGAGANLWLYGSSHATLAGDWRIRSGGTERLYWDESATLLSLTGNLSISGTSLHTGAATFTAAPRFNSVTASQFLLVDANKDLTSVAGTGSGSVVRATSPTITTPTFAGLATAQGGIYVTGGTVGAGRIVLDSDGGIYITGATGVTYAFRLDNNLGSNVFRVPVGTTDVTFAGNQTTQGTVTATGGVISTGQLTSSSGRSVQTTAYSSSQTLGASDHYVTVTGESTTITLPDAATHSGRVYVILNRGTANVSVTRSGTDTINGSATVTLVYTGSASSGYAGGAFWSDGTEWHVKFSYYIPGT